MYTSNERQGKPSSAGLSLESRSFCADDEDVTQLLLHWQEGDTTALDRLIPLVKRKLHTIACSYMNRERDDHTLQPTAVVNEVYLRLVDRNRVYWSNRAQFFGFAAQLMRRILIDYSRIRSAEKRCSGAKPLPLHETRYVAQGPDGDLLALDDALNSLARVHERQSRVVELHFFTGLTFKEIATVLSISPVTVKRDWKLARFWLLKQIRSTGRS